MSEEYLTNKKYNFLVFQKWIPVEDKHEFEEEDTSDYYSDSTDEANGLNIPNPVLDEWKLVQENIRKFADENNFWDVHTLFPLTANFITALAKLPGIEIVALQFTTKYRTRISIAKLFQTAKVKNDISVLAEEYVNSNDALKHDVKTYHKPKHNGRSNKEPEKPEKQE